MTGIGRIESASFKIDSLDAVSLNATDNAWPSITISVDSFGAHTYQITVRDNLRKRICIER